jgi:hypothetical protein
MQDVATETDGKLPDAPEYDFAVIAKKLGGALLKAAEDNVLEADNLYQQTKVLVEGIQAQVDEQARMVADMNGRLRTFGGSILEAHKKFVNGDK